MSEVMTTVLHDLCTQLDVCTADRERLYSENTYLRKQKNDAESERDRQRTRAMEAEKISRGLRDAVDRRTTVLDSYDRITLALFHYIVELSGFRDTARTKAERIALGHVVERLKEIRGWSQVDAESIGEGEPNR